MARISEAEALLIKQLRAALSDLDLPEDCIHLHDKNLIRWLRARKGNVHDAEQMFRQNYNWKSCVNIGQIRNSKNPEGWGKDLLKWSVLGLDNDQYPVYCLAFGEWDVKGVIGRGQKEDIINYIIRYLDLAEEICIQWKKENPFPGQLIGVLDCKGLSVSQGSYEVLQVLVHMARVFEANFPELLRKLFVVNAPWAFQIIYKVVSPAFDERTLGKITVMGTNKTAMREEMGKLIPYSELPKRYGGEKDDAIWLTQYPDGTIAEWGGNNNSKSQVS